MNDIGAFCASKALATDTIPSNQPQIVEIHGPRAYTPLDVRKALEEVTKKQVELRLVEKDELTSFFGGIFPPHVAPLMAEMTCSMLPESGILNDPENTTPSHRGNDTLTDVFRRMLQ